MVNNRYYLHMKKLKYLAALLCLTTLGLFTSCSKEYSDLIVGSWKLVSLTINGEVITDNVPAATWTFDAEGNVTISAYGGSESGRYNIIDKETEVDGDVYEEGTIIIDEVPLKIEKLNKKELVLNDYTSEMLYGGGIYNFERI